MVILKELSPSNFSDFVLLLTEREEVYNEYYYWKYIDGNGRTEPRGFIAYENGDPVGCIGTINKTMNGEVKKWFTWFAD